MSPGRRRSLCPRVPRAPLGFPCPQGSAGPHVPRTPPDPESPLGSPCPQAAAGLLGAPLGSRCFRDPACHYLRAVPTSPDVLQPFQSPQGSLCPWRSLLSLGDPRDVPCPGCLCAPGGPCVPRIPMGPCAPPAAPQGPITFILSLTGSSDPITPTVISPPSIPNQPRCTPRATHSISHLWPPFSSSISLWFFFWDHIFQLFFFPLDPSVCIWGQSLALAEPLVCPSTHLFALWGTGGFLTCPVLLHVPLVTPQTLCCVLLGCLKSPCVPQTPPFASQHSPASLPPWGMPGGGDTALSSGIASECPRP